MTLVSVTAYHSFSGEVEALNTPTIRRLTPSCRHQLSRIAHATTFLVNAGRSEEIGRALTSNPNVDLETLLNEKDRLYISAASEGTFWLTVLTKTKVAFRSLTIIMPLFYVEGRQALLDRMRANTAMKKLAVEQMETRLAFEKANKLIDLVQKIERIKDSELRERVRDTLSTSLSGLGKQLPSLPVPSTKQPKTLPPPNKHGKRRRTARKE
jgi:hypothetical protein